MREKRWNEEGRKAGRGRDGGKKRGGGSDGETSGSYGGEESERRGEFGRKRHGGE